MAQASETEECQRANSSNQSTITRLEQRIDEMIEERRIERSRYEKILRQRQIELEEAETRARQLEEEREDEAEAIPECGAYNAMVVSRACPDTARQLRERSRGPGGHGDPDGDGEG